LKADIRQDLDGGWYEGKKYKKDKLLVYEALSY
jgi:hypothetical protein